MSLHILTIPEAPSRLRLPHDGPRESARPLLDQVNAVIAAGQHDQVRIDGGEPLDHPDLFEALTRLTAAGLSTTLTTTLPGLQDDVGIRLFEPYDVRFRVPMPEVDPIRFDALTGGAPKFDDVEFSMRNLQAFAYPFELYIPITRHNVARMADIVAHLQRRWTLAPVRAEVLGIGPADDPSWSHAASWREIGEQLIALQQRDLRRPPRLFLSGIPALALPLEGFDRLDVRLDTTADTPLEIPEGYVAVHGPHTVDGDDLARRRVWLVTPHKERPGWRSHPMDRFLGAVSTVLIRPSHAVFSVLELTRPGVPYLVAGEQHGVAVAGRFKDPILASRFRTICLEVRALAADGTTVDLARLRALAHILRRSMKPKHDESPARAIAESH